MKNNELILNENIADETAAASNYAEILKLTPQGRAAFLVVSTGPVGDIKKPVTKTLAAMIDAGDCKQGQLRETAKEITGKDIKSDFQSIYELLAVFQAVIACSIEMTEAEFDAIDSSKLALLSPFLSKEDLKELLPQAVELAKNGGTAAEIRALKPKGETKEPKAVKAMREKAEAAEERARVAEERAEKILECATIEIPFYCTDISKGEAVLNSNQLRNRIKNDLKGAKERGEAESLAFQADMLAKAFMGACALAGANPLEVIAALSAAGAKKATGKPGKASTATVEGIAA